LAFVVLFSFDVPFPAIMLAAAFARCSPMNQAAVQTYGWLSAEQMIDGLTLGETTPGPLVMVVAYVGFDGASTHAALGPDALPAAGIAGAAVATFFTFLPSFLFILAGGPFVESTRGALRFTAPLTGVTAAVVGVIVNLAVYFAMQTFAARTGVDWLAAVVAVVAAFALFRERMRIIPLIAASAAVGAAAFYVRQIA
jgi:chromate transporter